MMKVSFISSIELIEIKTTDVLKMDHEKTRWTRHKIASDNSLKLRGRKKYDQSLSDDIDRRMSACIADEDPIKVILRIER